GVNTMKKGEVASLTIHLEYAFGSTGLHEGSITVPANSNVYYDVDLVSFKKEKDSWKLTPEKIEIYGRNKEEGNTVFKKQKYERASKRY
nr:FKBP-type peptidyl-prolyl cis-trans isomerase domain-containing protein [Tanacetum cinerariifolium]